MDPVVDDAASAAAFVSSSADQRALRSMPPHVAARLLDYISRHQAMMAPVQRQLAVSREDLVIQQQNLGRLTASVEQAEMLAHLRLKQVDSKSESLRRQLDIEGEALSEAAKRIRDVEREVDRLKVEQKKLTMEEERLASIVRKLAPA